MATSEEMARVRVWDKLAMYLFEHSTEGITKASRITWEKKGSDRYPLSIKSATRQTYIRMHIYVQANHLLLIPSLCSRENPRKACHLTEAILFIKSPLSNTDNPKNHKRKTRREEEKICT